MLNAATLRTPEFWHTQCPGLTIVDRLAQPTAPFELSAALTGTLDDRMREDGYVQGQDPFLADLAPRLGSAVLALRSAGLPPVFLFVFDEAWCCFYRLHALYSHFLGTGYRLLPDFWVWHVAPAAGEAGWRPHRDRGKQSLAGDRSPLSLTTWIPLSESTPLNGCMYVLPAGRDPVYGTDQETKWRIDLPSIRALPARPGDFLCWNQAVLHWGARSSRFAGAARMSMAFEFQRGDIPAWNNPLLPPHDNLDLASRLKLIAKQVLQYEHMYPLGPELKALAQELFGGG